MEFSIAVVALRHRPCHLAVQTLCYETVWTHTYHAYSALRPPTVCNTAHPWLQAVDKVVSMPQIGRQGLATMHGWL